jgi:hypothetical protein
MLNMDIVMTSLKINDNIGHPKGLTPSATNPGSWYCCISSPSEFFKNKIYLSVKRNDIFLVSIFDGNTIANDCGSYLFEEISEVEITVK